MTMMLTDTWLATEAEIHFALGHADKAKIAASGSPAVSRHILRLWWHLFRLTSKTAQTNALLKKDFHFDASYAPVLEELFHGLQQVLHVQDELISLTSRLYEASRLASILIPRLVRGLQKETETLASHLETLELSLKPQMRALVEEAKRTLKHNGQSSDWRTAFAQMRG